MAAVHRHGADQPRPRDRPWRRAGASAGAWTAGAVLSLEGVLGSGKTTLVKGIAQALEIQEPVTSPTFTLVSQYEGRREGRGLRLVHVDLYRINHARELEDLGLEELLAARRHHRHRVGRKGPPFAAPGRRHPALRAAGRRGPAPAAARGWTCEPAGRGHGHRGAGPGPARRGAHPGRARPGRLPALRDPAPARPPPAGRRGPAPRGPGPGGLLPGAGFLHGHPHRAGGGRRAWPSPPGPEASLCAGFPPWKAWPGGTAACASPWRWPTPRCAAASTPACSGRGSWRGSTWKRSWRSWPAAWPGTRRWPWPDRGPGGSTNCWPRGAGNRACCWTPRLSPSDPVGLLEAGLERFRRDGPTPDPLPLYLRRSEAEIKREG